MVGEDRAKGVCAEYRSLLGQPMEIDASLRALHFEAQQRLRRVSGTPSPARFVSVKRDAHLADRAGHAGAIAELLLDRQRFAVPVERRVIVAAALRHDAQLVVGAGHAGAIAELLFDGQRFAVPVECRVIVAAVLRHNAQLVVGAGDAGAIAELLLMASDLRYQSSAAS